MQALRQARWLLGIGLFAVLLQLLPATQARAPAAQGPLLAAFCGKVPQALIERLRAAMPDEVIAGDAQLQADQPDCACCVTSLLGGAMPLLALDAGSQRHVAATRAIRARASQLRLADARGPPRGA